LVSAQTQSDRSTITSPLSGVVLARNVDPGQAVVSSLQAAVLFQVAESLDRMSVDVEVDEADIGQVRAGQTADFTVAAWPDRVFRAVVHKVELAPKADSLVATYIACLHLDNPDALLRPGMTATARIQTQTWIDALLVPNAALRWAPEDQADLPPPVAREGSRVQRVWRLAAGAETPEPVEIVTSATDGRVSLLLDGPLADGDALVVGAEQARQAAP
jgi:HlyD family secretion protein